MKCNLKYKILTKLSPGYYNSVKLYHQLKMKTGITFLLAAATLGAVVTNATQAQAQMKGSNNFGAEVSFQEGTSFGLNGKLGASENFSIRPKVIFSANKKATANGVTSQSISGTEFGVAATFDFRPASSLDGGKSPSFFLGPEVSFWNGSQTIQGVNVTANTTIISLIGGVEYPINESLDISGKLTLPVSGTVSITANGGSGSADLSKTLGISIGAAYKF